jgi:hypothetical protein
MASGLGHSGISVDHGATRGSRSLSDCWQRPTEHTKGIRSVIVLVSASTYDIERAARVPVAEVRARCRFQRHVNGYVGFADDALLMSPGRTDLTEALRTVVLVLP